jgi:hypothetical protein
MFMDSSGFMMVEHIETSFNPTAVQSWVKEAGSKMTFARIKNI